ncbi:MAG TPA: 5-(carboxyamino)imidazole ribonucleotide synthase [Thermomicrobiales bacterium]|nr:5-(carboxyamino)imidazole ribonucleotide synthase [Thermomicrobiales bacterium]
MVPLQVDLPVVGIVGGGQLARMTIQAAISLGVPVRILAERADDAAAIVSPNVDLGAPNDPDAVRRFAQGCDVLTFDHELVDVEILEALEAGGQVVYPSAATLALGQDKRLQREQFASLGFPVPANKVIASDGDMIRFGERHGWPFIAKASRGGYDGRGVWVVDGPDAARELLSDTAQLAAPLIVEERVAIEKEIAVLVARRPSGDVVSYPAVETVQVEGMCREILAPAPIPPDLATEAQRLARELASAIGVVGLLAVELFVADGRLVVNEIAVRPHNSGHWTIEGSPTSQFEQHLRAILDWPLGQAGMTAPAVATVNILGPDRAGFNLAAHLPDALSVSGAHVHLYGKTPRPGRKLGHVTALDEHLPEALARARQAASTLVGELMEANA